MTDQEFMTRIENTKYLLSTILTVVLAVAASVVLTMLGVTR